MVLIAADVGDVTWVFLELGAAVLGLALLARLAGRFGVSAIPLYLLGGLAFGNGGLLPLRFTADFVHVGAELGGVVGMFLAVPVVAFTSVVFHHWADWRRSGSHSDESGLVS